MLHVRPNYVLTAMTTFLLYTSFRRKFASGLDQVSYLSCCLIVLSFYVREIPNGKLRRLVFLCRHTVNAVVWQKFVEFK